MERTPLADIALFFCSRGYICRYRLSPGNVTALADKDTGDAGGDIGFFFIKLADFYTCKASEANTADCFLAYVQMQTGD